MSAKWTFWAWEQKVSSATKKITLLKLADNANDDGKSWYSIESMANHCGMSSRTLQRQISDLEKEGFLTVERRSNRPSIYTLLGNSNSVLGCQSVTLGCQSVTSGGDTVSYDPNKDPNKDPNSSILVSAKPRQSKFKFDDQHMNFAKSMLDFIKLVDPNKKANLESWANTIRLMQENDFNEKPDLNSLWEVFAWANADSFWRTNTLCAEKFRKQFGQLSAKMKSSSEQRANFEEQGTGWAQEAIDRWEKQSEES